MSENNKKISFSFSKTKKKKNLALNSGNDIDEKIEYINSFDNSKEKLTQDNKGKNELEEPELVIPLISSEYSIKSKKLEYSKNSVPENRHEFESTEKLNSNFNGQNISKGDKNLGSETFLNEMAATEILNEVKNINKETKSGSDLIIKQSDLPDSVTEDKEGIINYDDVPVSKFGMAMLRGMGWKENYGIGKEPKVIPTTTPKLRPRGLGLGAKIESKPKTQKK